MSKVVDNKNRDILDSIKFIVVADRDAIGAAAYNVNGQLIIRLTSSVNYHISSFAYAAMLSISLDKNLFLFRKYQANVVNILTENSRRAELGQTLLPTPEFATTVGVDEEKVKSIMKDNYNEARGVTAYFYRVMIYWVLAHEVGHQILGHTLVGVAAPTASRKKMEAAADEFAARALVKMGYSVWPTIILMEYFAAIEQNGGGAPDEYPSAACRLANVFSTAWSEREGPPEQGPRDDVSRTWNKEMDDPSAKQKIASVLSGSQCQI